MSPSALLQNWIFNDISLHSETTWSLQMIFFSSWSTLPFTDNIFALPNIGLLQIILTWLSMLEYKPKVMSTAPFTGPISMLSSIKWQIHPAIPWNHKNPSQTSSLLIFCQIHLYRQILCGSGQCLWVEWSQNIFQPSKSSEGMWFFTFHTSMLKKWHKNLKRYVH